MTVPAARDRISEPELFAAYRHRSRTERCACGGWIVAIEGDAENIAANVRIHNLTALHQEWRAHRCPCWGDGE